METKTKDKNKVKGKGRMMLLVVKTLFQPGNFHTKNNCVYSTDYVKTRARKPCFANKTYM